MDQSFGSKAPPSYGNIEHSCVIHQVCKDLELVLDGYYVVMFMLLRLEDVNVNSLYEYCTFYSPGKGLAFVQLFNNHGLDTVWRLPCQ